MLKKVFNSRWYQKKVKTKLINGDGGLVGASCHNREELEMASKIKVDYCLLSPVKHKLSEHHLITKGMGWESFHDLAKYFDFPIYELGGMKLSSADGDWLYFVSLDYPFWHEVDGLGSIIDLSLIHI